MKSDNQNIICGLSLVRQSGNKVKGNRKKILISLPPNSNSKVEVDAYTNEFLERLHMRVLTQGFHIIF